ncbi:MAG: acetylglutamate kinase [Elusimicrobia bacterium]|nr:acetylglutamate kinase [Elusimicrobiota bacterium]
MSDVIGALKQAIPYVRLYKDKVFVVKAGGRVLQKRETLEALVEEVCLLHQVGVEIVLVHGGGPQATELSKRLGLETTIVAGRRVTDAQTLEVAKMVYAGSLSVDILSAFRLHQTPAVGVSGVDGKLLTAKRRHKKLIEPFPGAPAVEVDFGFVGDIESVDPQVLNHILQGDAVPVISPLACDEQGTVFNINADSIAEAVARALKAEKLIVMTDTDGILKDPKDPFSLVSYADIAEVEQLKADGAISGGMLPKVDGAMAALKGGVRRAHIINGTRPGALLTEVFTNAGCGTMLVAKKECEPAGMIEESVPA